MSGSTTIRMIKAYEQMGSVIMFLTGLFRAPAVNFYNSEKVEIDIMRGDEDVAIVIQDLSTGYRMNELDKFTNKEFAPPVYMEAIPFNSWDLLKREFGMNPFENPDFRANIILRLFRGMRKIEDKIKRAIELQASQVLQTGTVTLTDSAGNALYTIDYQPKATHFPTSTTTWGQVGDDKIGDLLSLDTVIRNDGLGQPGVKLFGENAWETFLNDSKVVERLNFRRADTMAILPLAGNGEGANYRGTIDLGNYKSDVYTYGARYKDPQTGNKVQYLDPGKVVSLVPGIRLDATFGAIPNIGKLLGMTNMVDIPELPGRLSSEELMFDLFTNVWLSPDGNQLFGGAGSRPLLIPTAIDQFGCLNTGL